MIKVFWLGLKYQFNVKQTIKVLKTVILISITKYSKYAVFEYTPRVLRRMIYAKALIKSMSLSCITEKYGEN